MVKRVVYVTLCKEAGGNADESRLSLLDHELFVDRIARATRV